MEEVKQIRDPHAEWLKLVSKPREILIVEDDLLFANLLTTVMTGYNCVPAVAKDGKEAVDRVMDINWKFDLVILDYNLPMVGGKEVMKAISRYRPDTPVVVFSGLVTPQIIEEASLFGLVVFAIKPSTPTLKGLFKLLRVLGINPITPH